MTLNLSCVSEVVPFWLDEAVAQTLVTAPLNPYGFMSEFEPTQQIRLRKISQTELVSQPAEYDVQDDAGGKFEVIEWSAVRSLDVASTPTAAEFRIAVIGGLFTFRSSGDWQWEQFMGESPPLQGSEPPSK